MEKNPVKNSENSFGDLIETYFYAVIYPLYGSMEKKVVKLAIKKTKENKEPLGVGDVGKVLTGLQNTIYHIGEYKFMKGSYRGQGKRNSMIEKRTKLIFKTFKMGSFIADIQGGDMQTPLVGPSLVDDSIETISVIFNSLNEGNEDAMKKVIKEEIKNPYYRSRVLKDIIEYWPGGDNNYAVEFGTPTFKTTYLNYESKPIITSLITIETKQKSGNVFGYLSKAETGKKNEIEIMGPYGKIKCKFTDKDKDKIRKFWDRMVDIEGEVKIDSMGNITDIPKIEGITLKTSYSLNRVLTDEGEIKLKSPIELGINFDGQWQFEHELLNIVVSDKTFENALLEVQDDIMALYEHYCLKSPKKLGKRAKEIQKVLNSHLGD